MTTGLTTVNLTVYTWRSVWRPVVAPCLQTGRHIDRHVWTRFNIAAVLHVNCNPKCYVLFYSMPGLPTRNGWLFLLMYLFFPARQMCIVVIAFCQWWNKRNIIIIFAVILELLRPFSPPLLSRPIIFFNAIHGYDWLWSMNSFLAKAQVQCKRFPIPLL